MRNMYQPENYSRKCFSVTVTMSITDYEQRINTKLLPSDCVGVQILTMF